MHLQPRVVGGVCIDCQEPIAAVCPYCGAGRAREREAALMPSACASCGQPYPWPSQGKAKVFDRTYNFLSSVIPYSTAEWEKLSILLNLLTPKLPAPQDEDLVKGILEAIDMDSYRVE